MKIRSSLSAAACVLPVALLLGACGGDDDDAPMAADAVPASALVSAQAFSAYAGSLPADDRAEPLSLDGVEPPTSETDGPIDVD